MGILFKNIFLNIGNVRLDVINHIGGLQIQLTLIIKIKLGDMYLIFVTKLI